MRLFLFDSRAGKRLSEEFRVSPKFGSTALPDNESAAGSRNSLDEDGLSGIPYTVLSDPNACKVVLFNNQELFSIKFFYFPKSGTVIELLKTDKFSYYFSVI